MVAHTTQARITVSLWRSGECHDAHVARDGYHAQALAISLIEDIGPLQGGDRLIVTEDATSGELPEVSRASHMGG